MGAFSRLFGSSHARPDEARAAVDAFLREASSIAWFACAGRSTERDRNVVRLRDWSEWTGPEDGSSQALTDRLNHASRELGDPCYAKPVAPSDLTRTRRRLARAVWVASFEPLARLAGTPLGLARFDALDPWEAKEAATSAAAFVGSLICVRRALGRKHGDLDNLWTWFAAGHWPCGYRDRRLIVL